MVTFSCFAPTSRAIENTKLVARGLANPNCVHSQFLRNFWSSYEYLVYYQSEFWLFHWSLIIDQMVLPNYVDYWPCNDGVMVSIYFKLKSTLCVQWMLKSLKYEHGFPQNFQQTQLNYFHNIIWNVRIFP